MNRIPSVLRIFGWGMFFLVFFLEFAPPAKSYLVSHIGRTLAIIVPFCFSPFVVVGIFGADFMNARLRDIAAKQGHEVMARVVRATYIGSEGNEYHSYPIIRFELEVEEGGKTRRASTELIDYGKVDYKNYPPGTEVRAKYDPQTGSIAMLDSKGRVLEKL
ncbi:MAG: hypothetical protein U0X74_05900 [Anaerolineales bacterium]